MPGAGATHSELARELEATRRELSEAKAVIAALRKGEADAVVVETDDGPKVYTLRSADEPYRTIVETLKEGAVTVSHDGVVLYCNEAFARLVGRDGAALIGRSLDRVVGGDVLGHVGGHASARSFECTLTRSDGSRRECLVSSVPHQVDGETVSCLLVTDLTGQALRLRHNAIIESTDDAVISFDRDGCITSWNRAAEVMFGYAADEAIGRDADLLVAPLARVPGDETSRGGFDAALAGRKFQKDTQRVAKDGRVIEVSVTASPIRAPDGSITGVSAIMRDIRARKQAETRMASILDALSADAGCDQAAGALPETRAPVPATGDQSKRRELVIGAGLLDVPREQALDQLTRLAASVLQAPVALITVIDDDRQFFLSSHGLAEPIRSARQTPLRASYCRHVIESGAAVVIVDAEHNSLVRDTAAWMEGFIAYLGVPIRHHDGSVIASLGVADSRQRAWTERELLTLQGIGRLLMSELESRTALRHLLESERRVRDSEQRLRLFVEHAPASIAMLDCDMRYIAASRRWRQDFRLETDPTGRSHYEVFPEISDEWKDIYRRALSGEVHSAEEDAFLRADGSTQYLHWECRPWHRLDGSVGGIIIGTEEKTERILAQRAVRESEKRLRYSLQAAHAGSWDWDIRTGRITWSPENYALYDIEPLPDGPSYADWEARVHADDIESIKHHIRDVVTTRAGEFRAEFRVVRKDGTIRWLAGLGQLERAGDGTPVRMSGINIDITERKRAEEALIAAHNTFRHLVDQSPFGIYAVDADFRLVQTSAGAQKVFENVRPLIGRDFAEVMRTIWPEPFASETIGRFRHTLATGEPYHAPGTVQRRADVEETASYDWKIERVTLPDGRPGVVCHFYDLSERHRHEERERLLMREVNHRAKNMLGLVQAIARQTAAGSPQDFVERFAQRIQALAASQDLLVRSGWQNVPVEALVRAQLGYFVDLIGRRILLSGPAVELTAAAAQAIGLALHELATNAAKYGALASAAGTVSVSWRIVANGAEPLFALSWVEAGGPPVEQPQRRGFGSTVTGSLVRMSLDGEVETEFAPSGLTWRLWCAVSKVVQGTRQGASLKVGGADREGEPACRPRVLVVEDEPLIAMEIAATLEEAGFQVVGPVASVDQALRAIGQGNCDGAVLDVNLGEETAEPIALWLARKGTPFVTVTGYTAGQLPGAFSAAPLVGKPIEPDRLVAKLRQSLASGRHLN